MLHPLHALHGRHLLHRAEVDFVGNQLVARSVGMDDYFVADFQIFQSGRLRHPHDRRNLHLAG